METIWVIPIHIVPVVSHEALQEGRISTPTSGLDRFNLTDVGDTFYRNFIDIGADVRFKGVKNPFPWEMVFKKDGEPIASLRGMIVGSSTFRSIFKLVFFPEPQVNGAVRNSLEELGRNPTYSRYWNTDTWKEFQKISKLTKEDLMETNERIISSL